MKTQSVSKICAHVEKIQFVAQWVSVNLTFPAIMIKFVDVFVCKMKSQTIEDVFILFKLNMVLQDHF